MTGVSKAMEEEMKQLNKEVKDEVSRQNHMITVKNIKKRQANEKRNF